MAMFDEQIRGQLQGILKEMRSDVHLLYFEQESACRLCAETRAFVEEVAGLSPRIVAGYHDLQRDAAIAAAHGVDRVPALSVSDRREKGRGVIFYGFPGGYEINSFLAALLEVSGKGEELPAPVMARIKGISRDVHIQVLITLTCPYCPAAVAAAHRIAVENTRVRADMIDSALFPELSAKYDVNGVPTIIINESEKLVGAQPIESLLDAIERLP